MNKKCFVCGCGMLKDGIPSGLSSITFWDKEVLLCNDCKLRVNERTKELLEVMKLE